DIYGQAAIILKADRLTSQGCRNIFVSQGLLLGCAICTKSIITIFTQIAFKSILVCVILDDAASFKIHRHRTIIIYLDDQIRLRRNISITIYGTYLKVVLNLILGASSMWITVPHRTTQI